MTAQSQALTCVVNYKLRGATIFTLWGRGFSDEDQVSIGPVQIDANRSIEWTVRSVRVVPRTENTRLEVVATAEEKSLSVKDTDSSSAPKGEESRTLTGDLIGDMNVTVTFANNGPESSVSVFKVGFD